MFLTPRPAEELYDVKRDPHQLENLAGKPEYANLLAEMRGAYEAWAKETNDTVPELPSRDGFDRGTGQRLMNASHPSMATEFKEPSTKP
jgi:hypothetical protein